MPVTVNKAEAMGKIMLDLLGLDLARRLVSKLLGVNGLTQSERESLHRINRYFAKQ